LADIIAKHKDFVPSWAIMAKALQSHFEMLLSNCGEDASEVWTALGPHIVDKQAPPACIFDANAHRLVDPEAAGIIEPAKVCRVSLGNALSVASLLITLGGIVVVPRDFGLESQLALSKQAFRDMMNPESGLVGDQ
jgi:chaperonin GroEL (HSP60 family)